MLIGYARVSTQDQKLDFQLDALNKAGCEKIYTDIASGAKTVRPGLEEALEKLNKGDTLVVWKMDRLARSIKHLIELVNQLKEAEIGFLSLQESIDTNSSGGKLIFHIFASIAEFERDLIKERTQAGLKAARARGRQGGRPKIMDEKKISLALTMMKDTSIPIKEVCDTLKVSKSTLYKHLRSELAEKLKKQKTEKIIKLKLSLEIVRKNDRVRGMKKTRKEIEDYFSSYYEIEKLWKNSHDYILTIPYVSDHNLDMIIHEVYENMGDIAGKNRCLLDAELTEIGGDRFW